MRKGTWAAMVAAIGLSGAGVALAGAPATNKQGYFVDLSVKVSPPIAGTAGHPRGVGLEFDSFDGNRIDGNRQENNPSIIARFGSGFKENGAKFPTCQIQLKKYSQCSKADQVATGSAEASFPGKNGAPPSFVGADLVAYNGSPISRSPHADRSGGDRWQAGRGARLHRDERIEWPLGSDLYKHRCWGKRVRADHQVLAEDSGQVAGGARVQSPPDHRPGHLPRVLEVRAGEHFPERTAADREGLGALHGRVS